MIELIVEAWKAGGPQLAFLVVIVWRFVIADRFTTKLTRHVLDLDRSDDERETRSRRGRPSNGGRARDDR